jgi:hypothetical protein
MRIHAEGVGSHEAARLAAVGGDPAQEKIPLRIEHTDVSGKIEADGSGGIGALTNPPPQTGYVHQAVIIDKHIGGALHVGPAVQILPLRAEYLDPLVLPVSDVDLPLWTYAYAVGKMKLSGAAARFPP